MLKFRPYFLPQLILIVTCLTILFPHGCVSIKQSIPEKTINKNSEIYNLEENCKEDVIRHLISDLDVQCKYIGSTIRNKSDTITAIFQDTLIIGPDDNGWFVYLNKNCDILEIRRGGIKTLK